MAPRPGNKASSSFSSAVSSFTFLAAICVLECRSSSSSSSSAGSDTCGGRALTSPASGWPLLAFLHPPSSSSSSSSSSWTTTTRRGRQQRLCDVLIMAASKASRHQRRKEFRQDRGKGGRQGDDDKDDDDEEEEEEGRGEEQGGGEWWAPKRGKAGRGEEGAAGAEKGNRPANWPSKVIFSQKLRWLSAEDKSALKRSQLPGIRVDYITDPKHVLKGQYGVYATRDWRPFEVVGEYVGKVVPPGVYGEYVATIDYGDRRSLEGVDDLFGVDGQHYGNEARMINHFMGIGTYPNVKLITAFLAELPHILVVVIRPIATGEELLLDYGPHYWLSKYHAPPPDPLSPITTLLGGSQEQQSRGKKKKEEEEKGGGRDGGAEGGGRQTREGQEEGGEGEE